MLLTLGVVLQLATAPAGADPHEVERARDRLSDAQSDASVAERRLGELGREFELAVEDYNEAAEHLAQVQGQVAEQVAAVQALEAQMAERQDVAYALARRLYQRGGAVELNALLGGGDVSEATHRAAYLRSAAQSQLNTVHLLRADRVVHTTQLTRLEELRSEASAAESVLAANRDHVERTLATQSEEVEQLQAVVASASTDLAAAEQAERERLERERLERERQERERRERDAREAAERAAREATERAARDAAASAAQRARAAVPVGPAPSAGQAASIAVDAALSQVGKPYRYAASGPDSYDCSGLTMWAWRQAGVRLPHSSRMQYQATRRVDRSDMQPGDLLFFGSPIHHVAMYIGDGKVVEAPYTGAHVRVNARSVNRSDLVGIGRPGT